jgi:UDP-N-acetylglucosamine--dolichyl-phosphate N-acetylglucosaminephosphotransferase
MHAMWLVQVGQTFIIACAVLLHNLVELAGYAGKDAVARDGHLFSAYLMLPLATTSLALLRFNW